MFDLWLIELTPLSLLSQVIKGGHHLERENRTLLVELTRSQSLEYLAC